MPPAKSQEFPVFDQKYGRTIGTVRKVHLGRNNREFWDARSLDGVDLGAHADRDDACWAIQDDWERGRPRNPDSLSQRARPMDPRPAVYLGH